MNNPVNPGPESQQSAPGDDAQRQLLRYIARWDVRLRLTQLAIWVPRGLAGGLLVGLAVALLSRMRPWLMPEQVLTFAALSSLLGALIAWLLVWVWPRPPLRAARYFDHVFGLQERSSTALEIASGKLDAPPALTALQARDTLDRAAQVVPRRYLRFRWRRYELVGLCVLIVLFMLGLLLANPQAEALAQRAAIAEALERQVQELEEILRDIEQNSALSEEQREALSQIVEEARQRLQQPDITAPEAVAELTQAAQRLNEARARLNEEQRRALRDAARALNQSQATQGVGQAMQSGNLSDAASRMESLARRMSDNQLTEEQSAEAADALEAAADVLEAVNPEAAEALRRAAEALRSGDNQAAAQALQEAASALNRQQQALDDNALSRAAQEAAQRMNQAGREMAQAAQPPSQAQMGEQPVSRPSEASQPMQGGDDPAAMQASIGQMSDEQGGQMPGMQSIEAGSIGSNQEAGESGSQAMAADGGASGDQDSPPLPGRAGIQDGRDSGADSGEGAPSAGRGEGDVGRDITEGAAGDLEQVESNNQRGSGTLAEHEFIWAPSFVGGEGGPAIRLRSDAQREGTAPSEQGEFTANPLGESRIRLDAVIGLAARQADQAMDADRVPGALRGVIREYFTGLQR
jgi:hypothetical protein